MAEDPPGSREPSSLETQPLRGGERADEVELLQAPVPSAADGGGSEGSRRALVIALVVVALLLLAGGAWWWTSRDTAPPPRLGTSPGAAPEGAAEREAPVEVADVDSLGEAPALADSDPWIRRIVGTLSSHPALAEWLVTEDLARTGVKVVANVAYGEDPRVHVPFLRPEGDFATAGDAIAPQSYARYDLLVDVFASLDPKGSAELYRRALPLAEEAFDELGYPGAFDEARQRAFEILLATPVLDTPPRVVRKTLSYHFADPQLEALSPAQKQLLRMGPENVRRIKAQLRRLEAELDS